MSSVENLGGRTHGFYSTYRAGCRCDECKAATRRQAKRWADNRVGKEPQSHGLGTYNNYGCRCEICLEAKREHHRQTHVPGRFDAYTAQIQADTLPNARRHGYPWTGPELEIAARDDLSSREVAFMLGRTLHAVKNVRIKIDRGDPKVIRVLGGQP